MSRAWLSQPERGSSALIQFCVWLGPRVHWRVGRAVVVLICAYYFTVSRTQRKASREFLKTALQRPVRTRDVFKHYLTFASTIHDRIFFLTDRFDGYKINVRGQEALSDIVARKSGCILLGTHLGSFDVVRCLGISKQGLPIRVLMYPDNAQRFVAAQTRLNPALAKSVIALGSPHAMIEVKECVESGGLIGILGDRTVRSEKHYRAQFMNRTAAFPGGPFLMASILKVPIVLFFGFKREGRQYDVQFELFAETVDIHRSSRDADIQKYVDCFAARLEHYCYEAPFNWFNFYDFWSEGMQGA